MLPIPKLNDQQPNEIIEEGLQRLAQSDTEWTDLEVHDPGVTFLELFAALKMDQMRSIDTIGSLNLLKFLKLLNITPKKAACARKLVSFVTEENRVLPKGIRLKGGDTIFQTEEKTQIFANRILGLGSKKNQALLLRRYDMSALDRNLPLFQPDQEEGPCFYIAFEKAFPKNQSIHLYFQLREKGPERTPLQKDSEGLSAVLWEYYGEDDGGIVGWHPVTIEKDETFAFLYSGCFRFQIPGKHLSRTYEGEVFFPIRAICTKWGYEEIPELQYVFLNTVSLQQKDVKCETIDYSWECFQENQMEVDSYLAKEKTYRLYIRNGNCFQAAEEAGMEYLLLEQENGLFRLGTSERKLLMDRCEGLAPEETVLRLVLYSRDFYPERILGIADGTSGQEYQLRGFSDLLWEDFEIMIKQREGWEIWEKTDSLDGWNPGARKYLLHPENAAIRFGDNKRGKAPSPFGMEKAEIMITGLSCTKKENGNIKAFVVNGFEHPEDIPGVKILDFKNAWGGRSAQSQEDLLREARSALEGKQRAVSLEDYKKLALQTPGLKLGHVTVIPLYRPGLKNYPEAKAENSVTLVVEPYCFVEDPRVMNGYVRSVQSYMEQYRLITTKLYVTGAERMPVDVYGEIKVNGFQNDPRKMIWEALLTYMDEVQKESLGNTIYFGEICNLLEELPCVVQIKYLELAAGDEHMEKNSFGDVRIPPHMRAYFRMDQITLS